MAERIYCIYKHTSPSGKSYIGQTKNYKQRVRAHKNLTSSALVFASAIKKYGWHNFTSEILKDNLTMDEANIYEIALIAEHNTLVPYGYNSAIGGLNSSPTEETKAKIKSSQLARKSEASIKAKKYFSIPENIKKHSEVMKITASTKSARKSYVEKGVASLPSTRKAVSEGMKKYHDKNKGKLKEYWSNNPIARIRAMVAAATGHAKRSGRTFSNIIHQPEKVAA